MTPRKSDSDHSWRVRTYFALHGGLRKATNLVQFLFEGFWLGIGDRKLFHDIDRSCYDLWSLYHQDSYNRSGLMGWEARAVDQFFKGRRRLLLGAAGGGRETLALLRMGFEVVAFECHDDLRTVANHLLTEENVSTRVLPSAPDCCPELTEIFDGLIIGWSAYMLIPGREARISFLRQLRKRVEQGAPLLLSFFFRNEGTKRFRITLFLGNILRKLLGRRKLELGDGLSPNFVHYFSREEIEAELGSAGFAMIHFETLDYGHAVAVATDSTPVGNS